MMWERKGIWFYIATVEEGEEQIAVNVEFRGWIYKHSVRDFASR